MSWEEIYPILTEEHLADYQKEATPEEKQTLEFHFRVQNVLNPRPSQKIISTSLFFKPVDSSRNPFPPLTAEILRDAEQLGLVERHDPWTHYVQPLLAGAQRVRDEYPEATLRVYLANDLSFLIPDLIQVGCEIHLMTSSSISMQPGMMWRFLALEEDAEVTIIDADRALYAVEDALRTSQLRQSSLQFWRLANTYNPDPFSYVTLYGCQFGGLGNLNVFENACALLWHCQRDSFGTINDPIKKNSIPHNSATWPLYRFDEWFLMLSIYPQMARAGILTLVEPSLMNLKHCFALDIEYCQKQNSESEIYFIESLENKTQEQQVNLNRLAINELSVFCVNLDRRADRRFVMSHTTPEVCGVNLEFISAVDGEMIPEWKLNRFPDGTTKSAYAIRLTMRLALRKFLKGNKNYLLYLEDDVVVTEEFDETILEAIKRGEEMVFLGGIHSKPPEGQGRWRKCRATFNNHALLFSREGAAKSLKILGEWQKSWNDRELENALLEGRLQATCVEPWVAWQRNTISDGYGNDSGVNLVEGEMMPYMNGDDLAVLDAALNISQVVLEYGCGGSTLHMGSRLRGWGRLVSIEHNRHWHEKVSRELEGRNFPVECVLREPKPLRPEDGPMRYLPGQLDDYVEAAASFFEEGEIDLAFVDGRERIRCALTIARLLKPGGLLMIHDFWPRHRYRIHMNKLLEDYEYLFDTPGNRDGDMQGMAVFQKRPVEPQKTNEN